MFIYYVQNVSILYLYIMLNPYKSMLCSKNIKNLSKIICPLRTKSKAKKIKNENMQFYCIGTKIKIR
jgi:hypothetical protein